MAGSSYPNRFLDHLTIGGVPITQLHPGEVFWVNGSSVLPVNGVGGTDSGKGTYTHPFATIDYAISQTTASRGDIIAVMPGHTETISAAGGIAADVAGVAIVGTGVGSLRPTITLDTAITASIAVSADNVTLANLIVSANFADITQLVNVTGAECHIDNVEFVATAVNMNWVDVISATGAANTADGLSITNSRAFGVDAANNSFLQITDDIDRLTVTGNRVVHDHANALAMVKQATGKKVLNLSFEDNHYDCLATAVDILFDNDVTTNTGVCKGNSASHADTGTEVLCDVTGAAQIENYGTGVITASGYLLPAADS